MNSPSKTDWQRVKQEAAAETPVAFDPTLDPYDPNDPAAVAHYWQGATIKKEGQTLGMVRRRGPNKNPVKQQTAIRFDPDVLAGLRATGKGWQTRVNEVMREWLKNHSPV